MKFTDKEGNNINKGDILFYSENIFGKDNFHYADSIMEVVEVTPEKISTITRIGTRIGIISAEYIEMNSFFECEPFIFDSKCYLKIGNIDKDSHKLTVEFAGNNFSLAGKKMGK